MEGLTLSSDLTGRLDSSLSGVSENQPLYPNYPFLGNCDKFQAAKTWWMDRWGKDLVNQNWADLCSPARPWGTWAVAHLLMRPCHQEAAGGLWCSEMQLCFVTSHVQPFAAPWTVACQAPLSVGILQARILEWVAMPYSREMQLSQSQMTLKQPLSMLLSPSSLCSLHDRPISL